MKILSIDTTMAACSAAIIDTEQPRPLAEAFVVMERGHAEALPSMVAAVMDQSGVGYAEIDRIAVTIGPGTFTGVRIGLSFARGLGLALGVPVIGIDSLSAIAANETMSGPLLVAADARNGQVYAASFDAGRQLVMSPHLTNALSASSLLPQGGIVVGTAAEAVVRARDGGGVTPSRAGSLPVAARFARLASEVPATAMPRPLYLRAPDAKPHSAPLRPLAGLRITRVGGEAAELLSDLHGEIFAEAWNAHAFGELLATPGTAATLAREGDEPLGLLVTRSAADEAEIITIGTRPSVQRRGVGRQLLAYQFASLARSGVHQLFLEVAASNMAALGLYLALGFQEVGRRKAYYRRPDGGLEDAIVMRREIAR